MKTPLLYTGVALSCMLLSMGCATSHRDDDMDLRRIFTVRDAPLSRFAWVLQYVTGAAEGIDHIAIIGDLNDTPHSAPLAPLHDGTSMKDIFTHPNFDNGGFPGTFGLCNASNKIDYMLLSPRLFQSTNAAGVFRKGMWPGVRPARWESYEEMKQKVHAGSDHACLFMDFDI